MRSLDTMQSGLASTLANRSYLVLTNMAVNCLSLLVLEFVPKKTAMFIPYI